MSEQKNPKMFKTVFCGGYQKSDVNEYIESMQAQFVSIEQTLKNTINHQAAELEELRCQIDATEQARDAADELQSTLDSTETALTAVRAELEQSKASCIAAEAGKATAEASLAAAKETIASLTAERDAAKATAAALTVERDAAKEELTALRAQYEQALQQLRAAEEAPMAEPGQEGTPIPTAAAAEEAALPEDYEALKLKAEQYDRVSAHIGAIMLKANAGAEDVMSRANAGAEDVMSRAKAEADALIAEGNRLLADVRVRANGTASEIVRDISRSLYEISSGCKEEITLDLDEVRVALRTLESVIENKYIEINRKLDYTKEEMEQTSGAIILAATAPISVKTDAV